MDQSEALAGRRPDDGWCREPSLAVIDSCQNNSEEAVKIGGGAWERPGGGVSSGLLRWEAFLRIN